MTRTTERSTPGRRVLLTGATGFVGRALHDALESAGWTVRCGTRDEARAAARWPQREWVGLDVGDPASLARALEGCDAALYLVHGMASHRHDFRRVELQQAETFVRAAERAGTRRIVYLGGVAAPRDASEHLRSRQEVGEALRAGRVSTIELRASMIVGDGSLSWLIVRDLAARLPVMVLPRWLKSRTEPVAIDDIVTALVRSLDLHLPGSEWFDVPGPELLSGREILERTAAVLGLRIPLTIEVPLLSPRLSSHWVRFVTRAEWSVAREVVIGLKHDLIARDDRFWRLIGHSTRLPFEAAARLALEADRRNQRPSGLWGAIEARRLGTARQAWPQGAPGARGKRP
jgi:uncharacterized protein YbjT (DUF2867 family)